MGMTGMRRREGTGGVVLALSIVGCVAGVAFAGDAAAEEAMSHRPRTYLPMRKAPTSSPAPATQSAPILPAANPSIPGKYEYYGGHVISHVQVINVYWGTGGKSAAPADSDQYAAALVNSPYMDWMGEYDTAGAKVSGGGTSSGQHVNRGTFLKGVTITPTNKATTLTDDDLGTELQAQITATTLPNPEIDAEGGSNTLFVLYFPAGTVIQQDANAASCNDQFNPVFCGYHGAVTMTVGGKSVNVPYSVIPALSDQGCDGNCGGKTTADAYGITVSHELAEAMTDPEIDILIKSGANAIGSPAAWYYQATNPKDPLQGEIGDICAAYYQQPTATGTESAPMPGAPTSKGWVVQNVYSQRLQTCLAEDPSLPACGSPSEAGASARPCKPCTASTDCTADPSKPACEVDATNPKYGTCVACTKNADCKTATTPVCDKTTATNDTCRACKTDSDCSAPTAKCATTGACVGCLTDTDCGATQTCDTATNACKDKVVDAGTGSGNGGGGGNGDNGTGTGKSSGCAAAPGGGDLGGIAVGGILVGIVAGVRRRRRGVSG
jgi:hypothetical protein